MADTSEKQSQPPGTSAALSRHSTRRTVGTTRSRASSPDGSPATGVFSGNHLDDHSHYIHHSTDYHEEGTFIATDENEENEANESGGDDDSDLSEKTTHESGEKTDDAGHTGSREVMEVRSGIATVRDIEAGLKLERKKTSRSARSARDPNLVQWAGPDDPENPKNWVKSRKWAATLVGM